MALFGGSRDISLFHNLNSELLKDIIQTEIAYYKFALEQTNSNVYGESTGKNYYEPMKVACLIKFCNSVFALSIAFCNKLSNTSLLSSITSSPKLTSVHL